MQATVKEEVMDYCARTDIATVDERKQQASIIETEWSIFEAYHHYSG